MSIPKFSSSWQLQLQSMNDTYSAIGMTVLLVVFLNFAFNNAEAGEESTLGRLLKGFMDTFTLIFMAGAILFVAIMFMNPAIQPGEVLNWKAAKPEDQAVLNTKMASIGNQNHPGQKVFPGYAAFSNFLKQDYDTYTFREVEEAKRATRAMEMTKAYNAQYGLPPPREPTPEEKSRDWTKIKAGKAKPKTIKVGEYELDTHRFVLLSGGVLALLVIGDTVERVSSKMEASQQERQERTKDWSKMALQEPVWCADKFASRHYLEASVYQSYERDVGRKCSKTTAFLKYGFYFVAVTFLCGLFYMTAEWQQEDTKNATVGTAYAVMLLIPAIFGLDMPWESTAGTYSKLRDLVMDGCDSECSANCHRTLSALINHAHDNKCTGWFW